MSLGRWSYTGCEAKRKQQERNVCLRILQLTHTVRCIYFFNLRKGLDVIGGILCAVIQFLDVSFETRSPAYWLLAHTLLSKVCLTLHSNTGSSSRSWESPTWPFSRHRQQRHSTECVTKPWAEVHGALGVLGGDHAHRNVFQPHNSPHFTPKP